MSDFRVERSVARNFSDKTAPCFGVQKRTPNGGHSFSLNLICLCPDDLAPVLGSVSEPRPFVGKMFAAGRKIVQVSIVSTGARQKFCTPLCHWVPIILQRREQLFSAHMFLNWRGLLWRPWNPLHFWRWVLGPSMDKIFARVVIRLAASLFLISQLVSGSRVSLTLGPCRTSWSENCRERASKASGLWGRLLGGAVSDCKSSSTGCFLQMLAVACSRGPQMRQEVF